MIEILRQTPQQLPIDLTTSDGDFEVVSEQFPWISLQEVLQPNAKFPQQVLKTVMSELYGNRLLEKIERSGLMKNWPKMVERRHALEMMACAGHCMTLDDLNQTWANLRQMPADSLAKQSIGIDATVFSQTDLVEALSSQDLHKLVSLLRNPLTFLEPHNPRSLWQEIESQPKSSDKKCMAYTRYQDSIARLVQYGDPTRTEFPFAPHECIAKYLGYAKPETIENGMIVPIYANGEICYYRLEDHINEPGMHAYLFTPIDESPAHPPQLVFRGTAGLGSLSRDFDTSGIGKTAFEKHKGTILEMISRYSDRIQNPFSIEISGHSLGAADAQRAAAMLAHLIAHQPESFLTGVKLFGYCSPKLDVETVNQWKMDLAILADRPNPPQIELNFAHHEKDLVTQAGDFNLCGANTMNVRQNLLLVRSTVPVCKLGNHHQIAFFKDGNFDNEVDGRTFTLFQDRERNEVLNQISELTSKQLVSVQDGWYLVLDKDEALSEEELLKHTAAEERLQELEREKVQIESNQKGAAQHSWLVWTASSALQPLKSILYHLAGAARIYF